MWGMSGLLSHLASVALLLHMLLGCCWHHAHSCQHRLSMTPGGQRGDDCDEGATGAHGLPAGQDHHGSDRCQGSPCVFTAVERFTPATQAQFLDIAVAVAPAAETGTTLVAMFASPASPDLAGPCPPLRLHLVNQVLLL